MTEPEQPANPPLTRKQLREIRNTGSTPVITPESAATAAAPATAEPEAPRAGVDAPAEAPAQAESEQPAPAPQQASAPIASAHLPRAADPVVVPPAPVADSAVDLGASPLTRRQARQQERIRTASVPVITPEVAAAHSASMATLVTEAPPLTRTEPVSLHSGMHDLFGLATAPAPVVQAAPERTAEAPRPEPVRPVSPWSDGHESADRTTATAEEIEADRERSVSPLLGAGLLAAEPEQADLPPSFDQLLARSTGSVSMPNALILSQAPEVSPIVAPLSSTGEVLITGTFNLPEGLGSTGHARGTADGKEVDATLVDGELPAHSSPTPIAASAAISTVKTAGEVIRPPVPEKGSKLMLTLAITAGALALALVGVLILAFVTGVL
ncbi:hypothetical protein MK786_01665 [Microbacterium sp. CFH 31415]|uniref:hypothetical protein n=1 Tax=Microbacterium sp. CFH 31415 TaxID=2921732 RepID=UPI001F129F32|nr:hypothetical protein [Microbacterium sp. CFH 31415]MCH6229443.1 hypothetical protein [Microbacterium sp. CFH 31415]